jgi:hypothetical protein
MAWTDSRMFRAFPEALLDNSMTGYNGLEADVIKAALFNNSVTPDRDAAAASTGYNTGTWTSGNAVSDSDGSSDWPAAGIQLDDSATGVTTAAGGIIQYDAADTTHSNTVTISNAYGCLVYNDDLTAPVADMGISFHYFGGAQSVTTGTFTIVWHANGLFRITV